MRGAWQIRHSKICTQVHSLGGGQASYVINSLNSGRFRRIGRERNRKASWGATSFLCPHSVKKWQVLRVWLDYFTKLPFHLTCFWSFVSPCFARLPCRLNFIPAVTSPKLHLSSDWLFCNFCSAGHPKVRLCQQINLPDPQPWLHMHSESHLLV